MTRADVRRTTRTLVRMLAATAGLVGVLLGVTSTRAMAEGTSVVIDDFAGSVLGRRTVTEVATTDAGSRSGASLDEAGGFATVIAAGGAAGGLQVEYAFQATDLTAAGSNTRLVVELGSVRTSPPEADPSDADPRGAEVSISVTDRHGATGSYNTTLPDSGAADLGVDLDCSGPADCLTPAVDTSSATALRLVIRSAADGPGTATTVQLATVLTTPGQTTPAGPASEASATDSSESAPAASPSHAAPASSPTGPTPPDGGAADNASPTGNGSASTQPASPTPGAPAVRERTHASASPTPVEAPVFTSGNQAVLSIDEPGLFTVTTHATPTASVTASDLPLGLSFVDHGDGTASITGTPAFDGRSVIGLTAENTAGVATQQLAIEVRSVPVFTNHAGATFERNTPGSFDLTTTGVPTPQITVSAGDLPPGLSFADNGDGTATIAGTPTAVAGSTSVSLNAVNRAGSTDFTLRLVVQDAPLFTSPDTARLVADGGSATVTTSGVPMPTIVVDGELPSWLAFDDFGDGTGTLRTVGIAPFGASTVIELRAINTVGADAVQRLRVTVA